MSKLSTTLVAVAFATSTVVAAPAWADRGFGHFQRGHPAQRFHPGGHHGHGGNGWAVGLGLLAGTAILLAATEPRPVISSPPAVVYSSQPTIFLQPVPASSAYSTDATQWWYHCAQPAGYYPYVTQCPSGWTRVPARPPG
ncbi:MAG: hypothetical protein HY847_12325 [Betaproteobacteria bacterium]|nr:hypothetical protein [Betaproteobacteria bacterium]